jgi:hypothetical protein
VIDIFSKYVWLRPLDKKGESVSKAFKDVLAEGRSPNRIRTDKGQEFRSRLVDAVVILLLPLIIVISVLGQVHQINIPLIVYTLDDDFIPFK